MANRVFYASQGVAISGSGAGSYTTVQGAQSVSVTSNFGLEQAFQLGHIAIYDNVVTTPEVTCTVSKVLDGYDTIYKLATGGGTLASNANDRCDIKVAVGNDASTSLSGTKSMMMTGMYLSSVSYTMPVEGNMTEECAFIGDSKVMDTGVVAAPTQSGTRVLRRQHFKVAGAGSTLPAEVSGQNITNVTINADLGRDAMYRLGQFAPHFRYVNFPLEVTCAFECDATGVDEVKVALTGVTCQSDGDLPQKSQITIALCDYTDGSSVYTFNLGSGNRLSSVDYGGGDTGGGNATVTYNYTTYNELDISG